MNNEQHFNESTNNVCSLHETGAMIVSKTRHDRTNYEL
jgi:hypothetical protein